MLRVTPQHYADRSCCMHWLLKNPVSHYPFAIRIVLRKWTEQDQITPAIHLDKTHRTNNMSPPQETSQGGEGVYLGKGERALKRRWCRLLVRALKPRLSLSPMRGSIPIQLSRN